MDYRLMWNVINNFILQKICNPCPFSCVPKWNAIADLDFKTILH